MIYAVGRFLCSLAFSFCAFSLAPLFFLDLMGTHLAFILKLALLLLCTLMQMQVAAAQACRPQDRSRFQTLGRGVWVWPAAAEEPTMANGGHVLATTLFLEGADAVLVDPGPSLQHGQAVQRALYCQFGVTTKGLRGIVLTHAHAENVLAVAAWRSAIVAGRLPLFASAEGAKRMREHCPDCLQSLYTKLGPQVMAGTRIVLPTRILPEQGLLRLGRLRVQVRIFNQAHSESDVVLWHPLSSTLVLGGLVYGPRLPELTQGSLRGWIQTLQTLAQQDLPMPAAPTRLGLRTAPPLRYVVGVGGVQSPEAIAQTLSYLQDLEKAVWAALEAGQSSTDAEKIDLPAYRDWAGYAARQGFNAQRAWRELEPLWMASP